MIVKNIHASLDTMEHETPLLLVVITVIWKGMHITY